MWLPALVLVSLALCCSADFEVTLSVYSGRKDPKWTVDSQNPKYKFLEAKLKRITGSPFKSILGYRGYSVKGDNFKVTFGRSKKTSLLESTLLDTGAKHISKKAYDYVKEQIKKNPKSISKDHPSNDTALKFAPLSDNLGACAVACPAHYDATWNAGAKLDDNNCYNYANNIQTDSWAVPGRRHEAEAEHYLCHRVRDAAIADGLKVLATPPAGALPRHKDCLVALVVNLGEDFHWYRLDRSDAKWSHKPGDSASTNKDNGGADIIEPRTADRGEYADFCFFMTTCAADVAIN